MKVAISVHSAVGRLLLVIVLGGLSVGTPTIGLAQAEDTTRHTMILRDVSLKTALERLAQTAQVNLLYDTDLVTETRVYCTARESTASDLLNCLLRDLQLDYYQTSAGMYVLIEAPREPPQRGHLAGVVVDATTGEPLPRPMSCSQRPTQERRRISPVSFDSRIFFRGLIGSSRRT